MVVHSADISAIEAEICRIRAAARSSRPRGSGFTLVEVLVSITILSILVAIGMPTFSSMIQNNRLTTATNDLLATLQTARSEAFKRGQPVIVCGVADSTVALPQCTGNGTPSAWIMFVAPAAATAQPPNRATILELHSNLSGGVVMRADGNSWISFLPTGYPLTGAQMGNVVFCDSRGLTPGTPTTGRAVLISPTGHPTSSNVYATVNAALTLTGGTCP